MASPQSSHTAQARHAAPRKFSSAESGSGLWRTLGMSAIAIASAVSLAACSGGGSNEAAQNNQMSTAEGADSDFVTETVVVTTVTVPADGDSSNGGSKASGAKASGSTATTIAGESRSRSERLSNPLGPFASELAEAAKRFAPEGEILSAEGLEFKSCLVGDGFGVAITASSTTTDCSFAKAVLNAEIEGLDGSMQNLRDNLKAKMQVVHPDTGEEYTVRCSLNPEDVIMCGADDFQAVYIY